VRPERLSQWKIPMTPSGIEPATFRLVVPALTFLKKVRQTVNNHVQCTLV